MKVSNRTLAAPHYLASLYCPGTNVLTVALLKPNYNQAMGLEAIVSSPTMRDWLALNFWWFAEGLCLSNQPSWWTTGMAQSMALSFAYLSDSSGSLWFVWTLEKGKAYIDIEYCPSNVDTQSKNPPNQVMHDCNLRIMDHEQFFVSRLCQIYSRNNDLCVSVMLAILMKQMWRDRCTKDNKDDKNNNGYLRSEQQAVVIV